LKQKTNKGNEKTTEHNIAFVPHAPHTRTKEKTKATAAEDNKYTANTPTPLLCKKKSIFVARHPCFGGGEEARAKGHKR
jgi:hypothetical protein